MNAIVIEHVKVAIFPKVGASGCTRKAMRG